MKHTLQQRAIQALELLFFFLLIVLPMLAESPPSADAFYNATPRANYGSYPLLVVQPGATSYIRFNLSGLPQNAMVAKATLRLFVDGIGTQGGFDVYEVDSAWSESGLDFSNAPAPGVSAVAGQLLPIAQYQPLFLVLGNRFGGDGEVNFALPNYSALAPSGSLYEICINGIFPE